MYGDFLAAVVFAERLVTAETKRVVRCEEIAVGELSVCGTETPHAVCEIVLAPLSTVELEKRFDWASVKSALCGFIRFLACKELFILIEIGDLEPENSLISFKHAVFAIISGLRLTLFSSFFE